MSFVNVKCQTCNEMVSMFRGICSTCRFRHTVGDIQESLEAKYLLFNGVINNQENWNKIVMEFRPWLDQKITNYELQSVRVICDASVNTPSSYGTFSPINVEVLFKINKWAEVVVIRFGQPEFTYMGSLVYGL